MRKSCFILSALFLSGLVWSAPSGTARLDREAETQVNRAVAGVCANKNLTSRQQQITAALDKVRLKADDPTLAQHIITLSKFKQKNETLMAEVKQRFEVQTALQKQMDDILTPHISAAVKQKIYSQKTERPNYGLETKGNRYIYLTDASGHGTQTILQEVMLVMKQVRQANPQAHILLATEFAVMTDLDTPIQFANTTRPQLDISGIYEALVQTANQLDIDLLALDDVAMWKWPDGMTGSKVGDQLLYIPYAFGQWTVQTWSNMDTFLGTSSLGVRLRNEQWARYLNAVEPYYDIVIVYSGDGHVKDPYMTNWNVPELLTAKNIIFNFYTLEDIAEEKTAGGQSKQHVGTQKNKQPAVKVQNQKSFFYKKTNLQARKKWIQTLPANIQTRIQQVRKKGQQAKIKEEPPTTATFEIYLPDATR